MTESTDQSSDNPTSQPTPTRRRWLMNIGLLVGAVLLLWGVNALYFSAAGGENVLQGNPGDVLYAAGFDNFEDEWQQYSGREYAQVTNGHLQLGTETSATIFSAAEPTFADFDATVSATVVDGSLQNEGVGMIFRLQEQRDTCDMPVAVFCAAAEIDVLSVPLRLAFPSQDSTPAGYYMFLISNDGYYSLWRGSAETQQAERITVWHEATDLINTGLDVENTIRVVGEGSQFRFFINDEPIDLCVPNEGEQPTGSAENCFGETVRVWDDDSYATGKIGLAVNTNRFPGTVVNFDDLIVTMPDDELPEGAQT